MMSNNIPMENYTNDTDGVENTVYVNVQPIFFDKTLTLSFNLI